jgi:uncharacterized RDD family membrane protein YckC
MVSPMSKKSRKKPLPSPGIPVDAPRERVELAGIGVRLASLFYDALLIIALNAIIGGLLIGFATPESAPASQKATPLSGEFRHYVLFPAIVLTTWLFYGYFWRKAGQTLGMQTWRIQVIRPDGSLLGWSDAFGRCAAAMILPSVCGLAAFALYRSPGAFGLSVLFGFFGNYLWALFSGRGAAWHDMLSRTVVIRVPAAASPKRGVFGWFSRD